MNIRTLSLFLSFLFLLSPILRCEEDNPCLHSWGSVHYDCTTFVSGGSAEVDCHTSVSAARSRILSSSSSGGRCLEYRVCSLCGERDNLGSVPLSVLSCGELSCSTDPGGHVEGEGLCEVYATCHARRASTGRVRSAPHDFRLLTDAAHADVRRCLLSGVLPLDRRSVSVSSLLVPVGTSHCFAVSWGDPSQAGASSGRSEYSRKWCLGCGAVCSWATPVVSLAHRVEDLLPPESDGVYRGPAWGGHVFLFPSPGSFPVRFARRCPSFEASLLPWWSQSAIVGGCGDGEFVFDVSSVGLDSLDHSPQGGDVHSVESGEGAHREVRLYVLGEVTPAQYESEGGNRPRPARPVAFTASPSGDGWPSVHPVLGGIADSDLSEEERREKSSYRFPSWGARHLHCDPSRCGAAHFEFAGEAGSPSASFTGRAVGVYAVEAVCGSDPSAADANDNLGVRRRFIHVCNPLAVAGFGVAANAAGQKVVDDMSPCDARPVPLTFGGDMNGIPGGEKARLRIVAERGSYVLYRDCAGTVEADASDLELDVTAGRARRTVYLLPVRKDADTLAGVYRAVVEYGIDGTRVRSDDAEDVLCVNWPAAGCGAGGCSAPRVTASNSSVRVQGTFGAGAWGRSGGSFQVYAGRLIHRLLDGRPAFPGPGGGGAAEGPCLRFFYGAGSSARIATAAEAASDGSLAEGCPVRVKTGRYCSEFTYRLATAGGVSFVDRMTVVQYLCDDLDASSPMPPGATPVAVTTLELSHGPGAPAGASAPEVAALNVTCVRYSGGASSTEAWSFTAPSGPFPGLTGEFTLSRLVRNGVPDTLARQSFSADGVSFRREVRHVGAMSSPALREERVFRAYPWGEELVSETGAGGTTAYEYNDDPAEAGYSRLRKVAYPQGNVVSLEYNASGELVRRSELLGRLAHVTDYEYSFDASSGRRTATAVRTVGGAVVSRSQSVRYDDRAGGEPELDIRFDEDGVGHATRTWYVQGPGGPRDIRVGRQENPDGTETRHRYSRSADSETAVAEKGVFSGGSLSLGTRRVSVVGSGGAEVSSETWFVDAPGGVEVLTGRTVNGDFDDFGRARTTTYLDGSSVTRVYGCCGVASETDRDGIATSYAYDAFGRVSHTERDGIATLHTYDELGNRTSTTVLGRDGGEITTSMSYDNGEPASSTDALGNVTLHARSHAASGDDVVCTETTTYPDGSTLVSTAVNGEPVSEGGTAVHGRTMTVGAGWRTTTTPVDGNVAMTVTARSDMLGRVFRTEYADGTFSMTFYNAAGQAVKTVSPAGRATLFAYDALGRQVAKAVDMDGSGEIDGADLVDSTSYGYGVQGGKTVSVTTRTRSQGASSAVVSVLKRSVDGLESWRTDRHGLTTHERLERLGDGVTRRTVSRPDGTKAVTTSVNGRTATVQMINADNTDGNLSTYSYDEFNRLAGVVETFGSTTVGSVSMAYDAAGNVLSLTVNGQTTLFRYDAMGRRTRVTAPGGVVTSTAYHPTGEVRRVDGASHPVEYTYNALGLKATMTTFKDAATPQTTSWDYDARGFLAAKTYADGSRVAYAHDADGLLTGRTWARGAVTSYAYDAAGRATGRSYGDGATPAVSLALDFLDRPVSVTDAAGTRSLAYGADGRLASETVPNLAGAEITYTHDAEGRRTGMELGGGGEVFAQAFYAYDAMGRVATAGNAADTLAYSYLPGSGLVASAGWGPGASRNALEYTYDRHRRLTGIAAGGSPVCGYALDGRNLRTGASLPDGTAWEYGYDALGQLGEAVRRDGAGAVLDSMEYRYDLAGNRTGAVENNAATAYSSNIVNQYTAVNDDAPAYDEDGNMLTNGDWSYEWNGENRLARAENAMTGARLEFGYDYMGRRVFKKVRQGDLLVKHLIFAYDGYKLIAEFDALDGNAQTAGYLWQPSGQDVPLMRTAGTAVEYLVADGNKNIVQIRDAEGNATDGYAYEPFGQCRHAGASANPFRFSSEYHDDETGLVYYNYRHYSPKLGRWISRDMIEEMGGNNMYIIANNNTINAIDINGNVSLATKIAARLGLRVAKSTAMIGKIHNWHSYSDSVVFDDEEGEFFYYSRIIAFQEIRTNAVLHQLNQNNYIPLSISQFNAAQKYGEDGCFTLPGETPLSTDWWLKSASVYLIAVDYKAKCQGNIIYYKDVGIKYEWHDIIDANSFVESYKTGNLFSSLGGFVSNTIEGFWDIFMDKIAGTGYKVIIKGNTSLPDGQFPIR